MKNKQKKIKNKNDIFFLTLKQKNDKIEFTINCQSTVFHYHIRLIITVFILFLELWSDGVVLE